MLLPLLLALSLTPGHLCSKADPDYTHHSAAGYPLCKRHVTPAIRRTVFALYGIPKPRWRDYELDHYIPLCAGGSNAPANLWPEPLAHAARKDRLEARLCSLLRRAAITQSAALAQLRQAD